jgi:hypothetical protein
LGNTLPTSKLKVTTIITIALLVMLSLTLTSDGLIGASQTIAFSGAIKEPLTNKQVTWEDGTLETLTIDSLGQIYLNGTKTVAFGLNIVTINIAGFIVTNKILSTLQNSGVRFMALDASTWLDVSSSSGWINYWMPLLYSHKMWVALYVADDYADNLPYPGGSSDIFNAVGANARVAGIVDGITNPTYASMIFAVGYNWELDNIAFYNAQVSEYLSRLYPLVKQTVDSSLIGHVPIVGKNMQSVSPFGTTAIVQYSDVPNYDLYLNTKGSWTQYSPSHLTYINKTGDWQANFNSAVTTYTIETLPAAGKNGMAIWFAEAGDYTDETDPNNYEFNSAQFNSFYNYVNTAAIFLWALEGNTPNVYAAFDENGNAYPWFTNILANQNL